MFIQTEATPNPLTLKFMPGVNVLGTGTAFFTNVEDAKISPLATSLFHTPGVTAIFLGSDFVTVTRDVSETWEALKPALLTTIMDHFVAGKPVMIEAGTSSTSDANDSDIVKQIKELIETRVRPAVAQDGGDIISVVSRMALCSWNYTVPALVAPARPLRSKTVLKTC